MEQLQIGNVSLNICIDFIQQKELIQKYNYYKSQPIKQIFTDTYMLKKIKKIFVFWTWTWNKKRKMPCIWEILHKLLKKDPFSSSIQIQKEKRWKSWKNESNMQVFSVKRKKQE